MKGHEPRKTRLSGRAVVHLGGTKDGKWQGGVAMLGSSGEQELYVVVADTPCEAVEMLKQAFECDHPGGWGEPTAA